MNTSVKMKFLDDYTETLQAHSKSGKTNRMGARDAQFRYREMQKQTSAAIKQTIGKISNIEEYQVEQVHGVWIKGPMKWIFLILGPNHHAKDIRSVLTTEYDNLNIIVVLVTNGGV